MTSFFRFVSKRAIYRLGIISLGFFFSNSSYIRETLLDMKLALLQKLFCSSITFLEFLIFSNGNLRNSNIAHVGTPLWVLAPVHVSDFPVVNVQVDELSSARIWQHKLCATLSASVNINYHLPIKVYYCVCTFKHIRIEINH
jgi:hypothetical protein